MNCGDPKASGHAPRDLVLQCRVLAINEDGGEYETDLFWCGDDANGSAPPMAKVTSDIREARRYDLRGAIGAQRAIERPFWLLSIEARTEDEVTVGVRGAPMVR